MKKSIFSMISAVLLVVGLTACGGDSNPLGVEAPAWEQFAHPKSDGVKLFERADEKSGWLNIIQEPCDGDACYSRLSWSNEKAPRGWTANNLDVSTTDAFPIIGEEGNYYKIYVSYEWLGAEEAYIKKSDCDVVKPVKITQEILDSLVKTSYRRDYVVQKGKLENLCLSSYYGEYDEVDFSMGQLRGNYLLFVKTKPVWLSFSDEAFKLTHNEDEENDSYQISFGSDLIWTSGEDASGLFDAGKLTEEQTESIYNAIHENPAEVIEVMYYLPDVDKSSLKHSYVNRLVGTALYSARNHALFSYSGPEEITAEPNCPFGAGDAIGYWYPKGGTPSIFIIYKRGGRYFDVDFDPYYKTFSEPQELERANSRGKVFFRSKNQWDNDGFRIEDNGELAWCNYGGGFVSDYLARVEWAK